MEITITDLARKYNKYPSLIRDIIAKYNLTTTYKLNPHNNKKCRFIDEEACNIIIKCIEEKNANASSKTKKKKKQTSMNSDKIKEMKKLPPLVNDIRFFNLSYFPPCQSFDEWFKEFMEDTL